MANIKISYDSPGGDTFVGDLDKKEVPFVGNAKKGSADVNVKAGDHKFVFFIEGTPGAKYTVKLEGAEPAEEPVSDVIAANRKAAGFFNFTVPKPKTMSAPARAAFGIATAAAVVAAGEAVRRIVRRWRGERPHQDGGGK